MLFKNIFLLLILSGLIFCAAAQKIISIPAVSASREKVSFYESHGYHTLAGSLGDTTIGPGAFVVIKDLTILPGKTARIVPNTKLLFESDFSLTVKGALQAQGATYGAVTFSNLPIQEEFGVIDSTDTIWSGINLLSGASISLKYATIAGCPVGVRSPVNDARIKFEKVTFQNISRNAVNIGGKQPGIPIGWPVDFSYPKTQTQPMQSAAGKRHEPLINKTAFQIVFGALALSGGALALYGHLQAENNFNLAEDRTITTQQADAYKNKVNQNIHLRNIGQIVAGAAATGFVITFCF